MGTTTSPSTVAAMAELLHTIVAVWILLGPVLMTFAFSYPKGRSPLWTLLSLFGGVGAFVLVRQALGGRVTELDPAVWAGLPLGAGVAFSLAVALLVARLPGTTGGRSWKAHLLEGEVGFGGAVGARCTLAVDRGGLSLCEAGRTGRIPRGDFVALEVDAAVIRLRWRTADGAIAVARVLPEPEEGGSDELALAAAIVRRVRRVMAAPPEQPGRDRV